MFGEKHLDGEMFDEKTVIDIDKRTKVLPLMLLLLLLLLLLV